MYIVMTSCGMVGEGGEQRSSTHKSNAGCRASGSSSMITHDVVVAHVVV